MSDLAVEGANLGLALDCESGSRVSLGSGTTTALWFREEWGVHPKTSVVAQGQCLKVCFERERILKTCVFLVNLLAPSA